MSELGTRLFEDLLYMGSSVGLDVQENFKQINKGTI